MRRPISFIALSLLVIAGPKHTARGQEPAPTFRANIDLVSLTVTVVDKRNNLVRNLEQDDFNVFEDGIKQRVEFFSRRQTPIAVAVLLDTSASMDQRLETAQEAAIGFAKRIRPDDVMEVVDFDSQVRILQDFTNDVPKLEKAIRGTTVNGSTSLYNALYVSLKALKNVKATSADEIRRQAIVVLSDGDDTSSLVEYEEVRDVARRSETVIYAIGLKQGNSARVEFKEAEFVLKQLSTDTGGRAFFPTSVSELPAIYQQISEELANQYTMAFSSKNPLRNGAWRRLMVRVAREGVLTRTRQGYFAPSTPSSK